jgi:hypothetical protein
MPINLISKVKPKNDGSFPTVEDVDIQGGYQVRDDVTDRNSIPSLNRKEGMLVFVKDDSKYYTLSGGLTDGYWVEINFGGSSQLPAIILSDATLYIDSDVSELIIIDEIGINQDIYFPDDPTLGQEIIISRRLNTLSASTVTLYSGIKLFDNIITSLTFSSIYNDAIFHVIYDGYTWEIILYSQYCNLG